MRQLLECLFERPLHKMQIREIGAGPDPADDGFLLLVARRLRGPVSIGVDRGGYHHNISIPFPVALCQKLIAAYDCLRPPGQSRRAPSIPTEVNRVIDIENPRPFGQTLERCQCRDHFALDKREIKPVGLWNVKKTLSNGRKRPLGAKDFPFGGISRQQRHRFMQIDTMLPQ
jgi:hypothetical protein